MLACAGTPEDTSVPTCEEMPRSIQVVLAGTDTPLVDGADVIALPGGGWAIDAEAVVAGLLTQDHGGLHTLTTDVDVESEGSITGNSGEFRVECIDSAARLPLPIGVPVENATELTATMVVTDETGLSATLQRTLALTWP